MVAPSANTSTVHSRVIVGIDSGEFDPNLDLEVAIDILYGPIYFRLLVGHLPLDPHFADQLPLWALKAIKLTDS